MTKVINLFAGPGAGKSTTAAGLFYRMKVEGVNCEYVTEWVKDKCWEKNKKAFQAQPYIFGKQYWKLFRCLGEVDYVITDSPILLSVVYNDLYAHMADMNPFVVSTFNTFENENFYLTRSKTYQSVGRNETEDEARLVDARVLETLQKYDVPFTEIDYKTAVEAIWDELFPESSNLLTTEQQILHRAWDRLGAAPDPLDPGFFVCNSIESDRWFSLRRALFDEKEGA